MSTLPKFDPPAKIKDFADDPSKQAALDEGWNTSADGWTEQCILGNPWTVLYASNQNFYFNPLKTDISGHAQLRVAWTAFPNRINYYYPQYSQNQRWELADTGNIQGVNLPEIPTMSAVCASQTTPTYPYPPYGPRGWLDEYCEWSVKRRSSDNKITRIDFTCENPEYWHHLWAVDQQRALEIYRSTLGNPNIQLGDLQLRYNGNLVIDPSTGQPAYNPLNKWNSGTVTTDSSGGAMHLTATPNTLQTELGLAGAATVQRQIGNSNASQLICCSDYGQIHRNSDPTIGQATNQAVGAGNRVSLADPIGLYIQMPDFSGYQLFSDPNLPPGATVEDCWQIVRGSLNLEGFPSNYNFILHAVFAIPQSWIDAGVTKTIGDITILGNPINWGAQVAETFQVALNPMGLSTTDVPQKFPCLADAPEPKAQPLQVMFASLWDAYYNTNVPNPRNVSMNLASNSTVDAPRVRIYQQYSMVLTASPLQAGPSGQLPTIEFLLPGSNSPDPYIQVTVTSTSIENVEYAVPGNTSPGEVQLLRFEVSVLDGAQLGRRDIRVTNYGQSAAQAAPFYLEVIPRQ